MNVRGVLLSGNFDFPLAFLRGAGLFWLWGFRSSSRTPPFALITLEFPPKVKEPIYRVDESWVKSNSRVNTHSPLVITSHFPR